MSQDQPWDTHYQELRSFMERQIKARKTNTGRIYNVLWRGMANALPLTEKMMEQQLVAAA